MLYKNTTLYWLDFWTGGLKRKRLSNIGGYSLGIRLYCMYVCAAIKVHLGVFCARDVSADPSTSPFFIPTPYPPFPSPHNNTQPPFHAVPNIGISYGGCNKIRP